MKVLEDLRRMKEIRRKTNVKFSLRKFWKVKEQEISQDG